MTYDCFVMLVTRHNLAIRSMNKALQHFKTAFVRLTKSFESDLLNELVEKRFLRWRYTKTRQSERVNNFGK